MQQQKIGKFIAEKRKQKGLTQLQLAEKLCITDRAVSKWETGRSMPDYSIMLLLCEVLDMSVNELLNGEVINMDNELKDIVDKLYNQYGSDLHWEIKKAEKQQSGSWFLEIRLIEKPEAKDDNDK